MSDLSYLEKRKFESLFGMASGYVLDFSNNTFEALIADLTGLNIYDEKYARSSGSKANRLRAFWDIEPNHTVGKVLDAILNSEFIEPMQGEPIDLMQCRDIAKRLLEGGAVEHADVFSVAEDQDDFTAVSKAVTRAIDSNELVEGLDRLHTYTIKFVRRLCIKHKITITNDKPLHSLFGEYVKGARANGLIHSTMTERILRSSISTLEAFNDVRNNQSLAHDNELLNHDEALFIFNHVASLVRFVRELEDV